MANRRGRAVFERVPIAIIVLLVLAGRAEYAVAQTPPGSSVAAAPLQKIVKVPAPPAIDIFETVAKAPVTVTLQNGRQHAADITITHYRPLGPGPFPAVIISHGRGPDRADPPRFRALGVARFYVRRGFAVFVPTRIGYGEGGISPDPENPGSDCERRDYDPPLTAMLRQIEATWTFAQAQPFVDRKRLVLVGQSYGGLGSIAATGTGLSGLMGVLNFAGGGGGNPKSRPGNPCAPGKIAAILAAAGRTAAVPTLWIYAENDKYWGLQWPRTWHEAYVKGGGRGELVINPPYGEDGHKLLESLPEWRAKVDTFLAALGFAAPRASGTHQASGFAPLSASAKVPYLNEKARAEAYAKFLAGDLPRAFAIAPNGAWGASWGQSREAPDIALERCAKHASTGCRLYAVDDMVVFVPDQAATRQSSAR